MKISGPCGRLLCCLAYEYDSYREIRRALPSEGTWIRSRGGTLKVVDTNIFNQQAKLEAEDGTAVFLPFESLFYDSKREQWRIRES